MEMRKLGELITQRRDFINIDDNVEYKRCRVQVNRKGVVLRDAVKGVYIGTKKQQVCKTGDFLVAEIDAKVGGYGFVPPELDGAIVSSHYFLFEINKKELLTAYLRILLLTDIIQNQINAKGSTNYSAIRPRDVLNFEIPYVSTKKQEAVVQKLLLIGNNFGNIKNELEKKRNLITKLRQSILQEAVQGKLVPQNTKDEPASELLKRIKAEKEKLIAQGKIKKDKPLPPITKEEIPFELPKNWAWCRIQEISQADCGSTPDKREFTNSDKDIPYLKVYNIVKQKVDFWYKPQFVKKECHFGQLKRSICFSGNVLMNIVGPPLGKVAIIPLEIPECNINQAIVVIRPFSNILNKWVYYYLCELSAINSIVTKGTAGQDNISLTQARELLIPLPPFSEQQRIVAKVEELMQLSDKLEKEVTHSKLLSEKLMQSVLREAFEQKPQYKLPKEKLSIAAEPE